MHAFLGFLYHIKTTFAVHVEARIQIAQSKFELPAQTIVGVQPLSFDVDYTGFVLNVGASKFF